MPHSNKRVELEMQIMKLRQLSGRINDDQFQKVSSEKIAELEKKLREIDE